MYAKPLPRQSQSVFQFECSFLFLSYIVKHSSFSRYLLVVLNMVGGWEEITANSLVSRAAFPEKVQVLCGLRV